MAWEVQCRGKVGVVGTTPTNMEMKGQDQNTWDGQTDGRTWGRGGRSPARNAECGKRDNVKGIGCRYVRTIGP